MELIIENVRCFSQKQTIPIRPLTLLVGENNTGKTTFLASYSLMWNLSWGGSSIVNFNEEPFLLGTYDQIANYRGGQVGRASYFNIGVQFEYTSGASNKSKNNKAATYFYLVSFRRGKVQPQMSSIIMGNGRTYLEIRIAGSENKSEWIAVHCGEKKYKIASPSIECASLYLFEIFGSARKLIDQNLVKQGVPPEVLRTLNEVFYDFAMRRRGQGIISLAPIRSKPERVYSKMMENASATGEHIPKRLDDLFASKDDESHKMLQSLIQHGRDSGIFKSIKVKRLGKHSGDPFQIFIGTGGQSFNLIDSGYGISQALPIIVDALTAPRETTFLVQQPEVHLHPRAQAGLGSFFAHLAATQDKQFIIETHSDYIIDRVCMDIRDQKGIKPEDVVILFFDKTRDGVNIHPIYIDEVGNIKGAPPSYRKFCMEEQRRYFGG